MRPLLAVLAFASSSIAGAQQTAAQRPLGRYETVECFPQVRVLAANAPLDCGWLTLPEVRSRPDGPTVRLAVVRFRVRNPTSPPLVYLHGGPGGAGAIVPSSLNWYHSMSAGVRDVIRFDQRAVGLSEPKLCVGGLADSAMRASLEGQARWNADARACIADMKARGRDPAGYSTIVQADDVRELRLALGYDNWDLFGVSYGGRLAAEVMRRDSGGVRAVILHSPAIPIVASLTEDPISVQTALDRLFLRCASQAECRAKFPSLKQDFHDVYREVSSNPLAITTNGGPVRFDGHQYLRAVRCQLTNTRQALRLPLAIHELRRGDRVNAATILANACAPPATQGQQQINVKNYLTNCADGNGSAYWESRRAVASRVDSMWLQFEEGGEECDIWQPRYADSADLSPVRSDIPTLIITGEFDERTPTDHARRASEGLSRKYLIEIPGDGHGTPPTGCQAELIREFLRDPMREPDTSCIATIGPIPFATASLTVPNLRFTIESNGNGTRFDGLWEAEFPNVPRPFNVQIRIDGTRVTGMWNPNQLPLIDGSVSGDTLRFSVKSPDGTRTIRFLGTLDGNAIAFHREVDAPPGTGQGPGIFGAAGARTFTATRSP
jgi:pimeloyl-ACP methyl ester carboxylesterase